MARPKNKVKTIQVRGYHPITGEQKHITRIPVTQKKLIPHIREEWKKRIIEEYEKEKQGFKDITFAVLATKYLQSMQDGNRTDKSIKNALRTFEECIDLGWGDMNAKEITSSMVATYIKSKRTKKVRKVEQPGKKPYYRKTGGNRTADIAQAYLKAMYQYGIDNLHVTHNPVLALGKIAATEPDNQSLQINDEIIAQIKDACDTQDYKDLISLLYITAARPIEWFRAKFSDIDWDKGHIKLYSGKIRKGRLVPKKIRLSEPTVEILDRRYKEWNVNRQNQSDNNNDGYVFWRNMMSPKGKPMYEGPYRSEGDLMKRINNKLGASYTLYDLKRASITKLVEMKDNGEMSLKDVMAITGQTDERTVNRYVIPDTSKQVRAMNKLGGLLI